MAQVAVIWFGGHLVQQGSMGVGSLIAFINYLMQIFMSVMMAGFIFVMVPRGSVSAKRIMEVLNTKSDLEVTDNPLEVSGPAEFALQDVTVAYPGAREPVLENLSISFQRGTVTGVVGPTASGKSTLVNILPRLFDVSEGEVALNGHSIGYTLTTSEPVSRAAGLFVNIATCWPLGTPRLTAIGWFGAEGRGAWSCITPEDVRLSRGRKPELGRQKRNLALLARCIES